jgi:carboxyl-terminal processing protease
VGSVPDSLKKAFKTTHGRTVYDGGGIDPDTGVKYEKLSPLTEALLDQGIIFDYATLYASRHAAISEARKFSLTDAEYQEFANWVKGRSYTYQYPLEAQLQQLQKTARAERLYNELRPQIDQLQARLTDARKNDLITFRDEVKRLLEEEIVGRYYLERGRVEVTFKDDPEVLKSVDLLANKALYSKTLNH